MKHVHIIGEYEEIDSNNYKVWIPIEKVIPGDRLELERCDGEHYWAIIHNNEGEFTIKVSESEFYRLRSDLMGAEMGAEEDEYIKGQVKSPLESIIL